MDQSRAHSTGKESPIDLELPAVGSYSTDRVAGGYWITMGPSVIGYCKQKSRMAISEPPLKNYGDSIKAKLSGCTGDLNRISRTWKRRQISEKGTRCVKSDGREKFLSRDGQK